MPIYLVNREPQVTGEHQFHITTCKHLPKLGNQLDLGYFYICQDAIKEAKNHYVNVDGCKHCIPNCHTR